MCSISYRVNFILETAYDSPCIQPGRTNFWRQNGYFWKVPVNIKFQAIEKTKFLYRSFSCSLTVDYIKMYKFFHQNCLRLPMHIGWSNTFLAPKWLLLESSNQHIIQKHWKNKFYYKHFSLTVEHTEMYKFPLQNCLWFPKHTGY